MKILIVFTHPNPQGFNGAILKQIQTNLSIKRILEKI